MNPEITHASDNTSRFEMARESQSLEVEMLESPAPAESEAGVAPLASSAGGPRTPKGKARSKRNALRHGIFSKVVLLKEEPRAEFDSLLRGLQSDLKPEGTLEGLLVDNLAAISWRKRRLLIAEGAEIRKGTEFIEWEAKRQRDDEAANISFLDVQCSGLVSQITNPKVLEKCLDLLQRLHKEIEEGGFDEKEDKAILARLYGDSGGFGGVENSLFDVYSSCVSTANSHASAHEGGEVMFLSPAACKYKFFHFLNKEITRLQRYKKERAHIESNKMEIEWLRANVPDASQLDRLLRYETTLQRDFDRTLSQLERLQRMRLGQPVLPKLEVQHSLS